MNNSKEEIINKYKNRDLVFLVLYDYTPISKRMLKEVEKLKDKHIIFEFDYFDKEEPQIIILKKGKILEILKGIIPKELLERKILFYTKGKEILNKLVKF